jgi:hypothetical protein
MKHEHMTCEAAREQFAMLVYGELSFDEEERVESHLDACRDCRGALERQREMHAALDAAEVEPAASLLRECRENLRARLMEEEAPPAPARTSWWDRFIDGLTLGPVMGAWRPAGALALIALGFGAARMMPMAGFSGSNIGAMSMVDPGAARVRYVEPAADGRIQIVLDETRQRIISGKLDDQRIRALLLTAAKDPADPGLRAESVDILNSRAQSADIRDALAYAVQHDQNAGVRMKAMGGLRPYACQPEVRSALAHVLLSDSNPGLRTQAIDLLTAEASGCVDRKIVPTLQELMGRGEQQQYIRERSRRVLEMMNASPEVY